MLPHPPAARPSAPVEFPLWPGLPPGAKGDRPGIDLPTLTFYPAPQNAKPGAAMVLCPGGGYWELMDGYEGRDFALWLNERGISGLVLKYRLAAHGYHYPEITADITRALRMVRAKAGAWGIDPTRIGVMGGSAGGHLASYALVHPAPGDPASDDPVERADSRPALGVLCYPWISMELTTVKNLLGEAPSPDLIRYYSSDLHVTPQTPPCFVWHAQPDALVSVEPFDALCQCADLPGRQPFAAHLLCGRARLRAGGEGLPARGLPGAAPVDE